MKIIQNVADTISNDPALFTERGMWDSWKSHNPLYLVEEYIVAHTALNDYEIRIEVLDEDQLPLATAVVDIYDDLEEAKLQVSYVAGLLPRQNGVSEAQVKALHESYDLFVANVSFPTEPRQDFHDYRLVQRAISYVMHSGKDVDEFFAAPASTRKRTFTDNSQHPFRAVATEIARKFVESK